MFRHEIHLFDPQADAQVWAVQPRFDGNHVSRFEHIVPMRIQSRSFMAVQTDAMPEVMRERPAAESVKLFVSQMEQFSA